MPIRMPLGRPNTPRITVASAGPPIGPSNGLRTLFLGLHDRTADDPFLTVIFGLVVQVVQFQNFIIGDQRIGRSVVM